MWFLYLVCLIIVLIINYIIAKKFSDIAEMKGHEGSTYFWFTFIFGVVGMLMVIAVPEVLIEEAPEQSIIKPKDTVGVGEWKCTCGKIHKDYETSCVCGVTKISSVKQATRQNAWDHWNEEHSSIGRCEICGTKGQFLVFAEFQENDQTLQKNLCFECFSHRECKHVIHK